MPRFDDFTFGLMNRRMQGRRGMATQPSRSPSGLDAMQRHPAVEFGRQMTNSGPGPEGVDRLSREVFSRLANSGIYRDDKGSWQIKGMERNDPSLQIRDSAVSAMGGSQMLNRVRGADRGIFGAASGPAANLPSNRGGQVVPPSGPTTQQPGSSTFGRSSIGSGASIPGGSQQQSPSQPSAPTTPSFLSGLGQRISGQVQQGLQNGQQSSPQAQSIQQVVESRLRQQGQASPPSQSSSPATGNTVFGNPSINMPQRTIPGADTSPFPPQGQGVGRTSSPVMQGQMPIQQPSPAGGLRAMPEKMGPAYNPSSPGSGGTLGSYGNQTIDQWDQAFIAAGSKYGVDPTLLKAMMDIESGGNGNLSLDQCRDDGTGQVSCGPMQIKPGIWGSVGSVPEQIDQAAKILADGVASGKYATHKDALFGIYFPGDDPNGTTQGSYGARVNELQAQMGPYSPSAVPQASPGHNLPIGSNAPLGSPAIPGSNVRLDGSLTPAQGQPQGEWFPGSNVPMAIPGTQPGVPPNQNVIAPSAGGTMALGPNQPVLAIDNNPNLRTQWGPNSEPVAMEGPETVGWMDLLAPGMSTSYLSDPDAYGFKDDQGINMYCNYWDWSCTAHTGIDIPMNPGTEYGSLVNGTVVCLGGQGQADTTRSGYSCGSYDDVGGGIGNLSVMTADKAIVTYGHSRQSYYNLGDTVQVGQPLGLSGENNGGHLHMEVRLPIAPDGGYVLVDPNLYFGGHYCDMGYCPY